MRFKRCLNCHAVLTKETRAGDFCSLKCLKKYCKKTNDRKWVSKDIQDLIKDMRITTGWYNLMEQDAKAKKKSQERGDQRRRGIY